jgi:hypothetical protein
MTQKLTKSRISDYLLLAGMLLLFAVGGIVTLNCTPSKSVPQGKLEPPGQPGVKALKDGGISFDITDPNVTYATFVLPTEVEIDGQPRKVTWVPVNPNDATVAGNVATVFKDERKGRTVKFKGTYIYIGKTEEIEYPLSVENF